MRGVVTISGRVRPHGARHHGGPRYHHAIRGDRRTAIPSAALRLRQAADALAEADVGGAEPTGGYAALAQPLAASRLRRRPGQCTPTHILV